MARNTQVPADHNPPAVTRTLAEFVANHPSQGWSDVVPGSLSFGQLNAATDRLARLLAINRAQPGARVAILAPLGPEAILSVLACLRAGLSPMLLPMHGKGSSMCPT